MLKNDIAIIVSTLTMLNNKCGGDNFKGLDDVIALSKNSKDNVDKIKKDMKNYKKELQKIQDNQLLLHNILDSLITALDKNNIDVKAVKKSINRLIYQINQIKSWYQC